MDKMKEKGVGFGHLGGCFDGVRAMKRGWGDDFCDGGLCRKKDVWWPKEGYEERFWRVFCGFLEEKGWIFMVFMGTTRG